MSLSALEWLGLGLIIAAFASALALVRRDYDDGEVLSSTTVILVWMAYILHAGMVVWFSVRAPLDRLWLPATEAHLGGAFLCGFGIAVLADGIATFASLERISGLDTGELVTEGIYRYSRNPQNLGWGIALFGVSLAGRSLAALGLTALFALTIHLYLVWLEEPHLEKIFGEAYRRYREQTPRYLGIPSAPSSDS